MGCTRSTVRPSIPRCAQCSLITYSVAPWVLWGARLGRPLGAQGLSPVLPRESTLRQSRWPLTCGPGSGTHSPLRRVLRVPPGEGARPRRLHCTRAPRRARVVWPELGSGPHHPCQTGTQDPAATARPASTEPSRRVGLQLSSPEGAVHPSGPVSGSLPGPPRWFCVLPGEPEAAVLRGHLTQFLRWHGARDAAAKPSKGHCERRCSRRSPAWSPRAAADRVGRWWGTARLSLSSSRARPKSHPDFLRQRRTPCQGLRWGTQTREGEAQGSRGKKGAPGTASGSFAPKQGRSKTTPQGRCVQPPEAQAGPQGGLGVRT